MKKPWIVVGVVVAMGLIYFASLQMKWFVPKASETPMTDEVSPMADPGSIPQQTGENETPAGDIAGR